MSASGQGHFWAQGYNLNNLGRGQLGEALYQISKTRVLKVFSCVRSAMLHASEIWPLIKPNLQHLQRNDRAMIRQTCNVRSQDVVTTRTNELFVRLGMEDLDLILKEGRLRWYGHVERSNGAVRTAFHIQVKGKLRPGRPMTWKQLTERDCRQRKFSAINPHDRNMWRSGVRFAMHSASQLSGRGPTDVGGCPCTCMLIKNLTMIYILNISLCKTCQPQGGTIFGIRAITW